MLCVHLMQQTKNNVKRSIREKSNHLFTKKTAASVAPGSNSVTTDFKRRTYQVRDLNALIGSVIGYVAKTSTPEHISSRNHTAHPAERRSQHGNAISLLNIFNFTKNKLRAILPQHETRLSQ